jgi:hypothetical protein
MSELLQGVFAVADKSGNFQADSHRLAYAATYRSDQMIAVNPAAFRTVVEAAKAGKVRRLHALDAVGCI